MAIDIGFCNLHKWEVVGGGAVSGTAICKDTEAVPSGTAVVPDDIAASL